MWFLYVPFSFRCLFSQNVQATSPEKTVGVAPGLPFGANATWEGSHRTCAGELIKYNMINMEACYGGFKLWKIFRNHDNHVFFGGDFDWWILMMRIWERSFQQFQVRIDQDHRAVLVA